MFGLRLMRYDTIRRLMHLFKRILRKNYGKTLFRGLFRGWGVHSPKEQVVGSIPAATAILCSCYQLFAPPMHDSCFFDFFVAFALFLNGKIHEWSSNGQTNFEVSPKSRDGCPAPLPATHPSADSTAFSMRCSDGKADRKKKNSGRDCPDRSVLKPYLIY